MATRQGTAQAGDPPPPPPPVIPSSWLAPHEQRWAFISTVGLLEVIKVWDILAPYFVSDLEPTWSSAIQVRGPWTATGWAFLEIAVVSVVSLLRVPMLSPSLKQVGQLAGVIVVWNVVCCFFADPGAFFLSVNLVGPAALGGEWYWSWWYSAKRWREPSHLEGVHTVRLLPYSTATLNPLSLSYCIPPDSPETLYIPIVFNNSIPDRVSYYVRSLDTGHAELKTVAGSTLKRSTAGKPRLQIANEEENEEDPTEPETSPLSALILRGQSGELDVTKLSSVKPSDSLAHAPQDLESSQGVRFLSVDRPSVVSLKSVLDKRGDRFHIVPHKEAIIVECPTGGRWMEAASNTQLIRKSDKKRPAEMRCVGDEELVQFEARGVGALRVGWRKQSKESTKSGVVEGIEDQVESVDQLALVRRDRMSKTHTVPLRVVHDRPGVYTVLLTGVTDSLHNSYVPSGHSTEMVFNVLSRPSARFDCSGVRELLIKKTTTIPVVLGESGESVDIAYSFRASSGQVSTKSLRTSKRSELIIVTEPGTYTLLEVEGSCSGSVMEPSSCVVQLVPPPTVEMQVTTLHECAMDVGVTASFDFTGSPPFVLEYSEQRQGGRPASRSAEFKGYHGEITLQPDQEGEYTYGSGPLSLTYLKSWAGKADNVTVDIPSGRSSVSVPVPPELSADSGATGRLSIALAFIVDGNGCLRKLSARSVDVDINRQRPTARFARSEKVIIVDGDVAKAGLRLTGDPPWEISYTLDAEQQKKVTLRDPNNQLSFDKKGVYRLTQVKDSHCPGTVPEEDATFQVDFKPRPAVDMIQSSSVSRQGDVYRHKGLCAGEEDQVALRFNGQSPFELGYRYTTEGHTSKHALKSAQETGILHLATEPGHHRYDFLDLKDTNYPDNPVSIALEHDIYSRPSVNIVKSNTNSICLDQSLRGDAKVQLKGKAPFILTLTVRKPASTKLEEHHIQVEGHDWILELPQIMTEVGRHEVTITSVSDSSGCEQVINESDRLVTTVEVVESARIVPATQQTDLCVGDTLDFLLQGKAPWTIEYEWLRRRHKVTSSASRFSRYAEEKGVFAVKSVALKDNQCKREVANMERTVHPLPSVKIQEGIDSLREGDEPAVFSVTFSGTPPFSFTYTRSEQSGSRSKVVETQTVTDIWTNTYTISSSSPGDYAVTSVSDKYCRYPPLSLARKDT